MKTAESSPAVPSASAEEAQAAVSSSLLSIFHDDILLCILGFVADVPFEVTEKSDARSSRSNVQNQRKKYTDPASSLTHTLPLVSNQFHKLCSTHDLFWKSALLRLVKRDALWGEGLCRLVYDAECRDIRQKLLDSTRVVRRDKRTRNEDIGKENNTSDTNKDGSDPQCNVNINLSKDEILLNKVCASMEQHPPEHHTASSSGIYQCIYKSVLQHHVRFQAPVFYMPSAIRLGTEYGLHFFEPRYRILISEVMSSHGVSDRRGERISPHIPGVYPATPIIRDEATKIQLLDFLERNETMMYRYHTPMFLHAHQAQLGKNSPATIVQVKRCQIYPNGSADVMLLPVGYVWIEQLWERPGTGGLIEARGVRMEKDTEQRYEMWCAMSAFGNGDGRGRGQMLPIP